MSASNDTELMNMESILKSVPADYQVNTGNMHLTIDDLVILKRRFDLQDENICMMESRIVTQLGDIIYTQFDNLWKKLDARFMAIEKKNDEQDKRLNAIEEMNKRLLNIIEGHSEILDRHNSEIEDIKKHLGI